jgi:hypothetical protein
VALSQVPVVGFGHILVDVFDGGLLLLWLSTPAPGVAEPHLGNDVERCRVRASVPSSDSEEDLIGVIGLFRGLNKDIPISVVVKSIGVCNLVFLIFLSSSGVLVNEIFIRELLLWVLVKEFHV